jgi:hypothetical protein
MRWRSFSVFLALFFFSSAAAFGDPDPETITIPRQQWEQFKTDWQEMKQLVSELMPTLEGSRLALEDPKRALNELKESRNEQKEREKGLTISLQTLTGKIQSLEIERDAWRIAAPAAVGAGLILWLFVPSPARR